VYSYAIRSDRLKGNYLFHIMKVNNYSLILFVIKTERDTIFTLHLASNKLTVNNHRQRRMRAKLLVTPCQKRNITPVALI